MSHLAKLHVFSVSGFFVQDKEDTDPDDVGPTPDRFGLVYGHHDYWKKFDNKIKKLKRKSGRHTTYKVVWLGRHGEGYHNVAQSYYGDKAWDEKWARKNGNGTITWGPDSKLTNLGISQAERVHSLWQRELAHGGSIAHPTALFVSPLSRAMSTLEITYAGIVTNDTKLEPLIMENLRDTYGLRTADKRVKKTLIHLTYPSFRFEDGFTEEDELWMPGEREKEEHREKRTAKALDEILRVKDTCGSCFYLQSRCC
ncbi:hypothetical protein FRB94_006998 [Tulasnella sp. JGI-2019a]|nr:hypothetical protein FRB94_006998 [Tulasnella sp. JGI-2019a]